MRSFHPFPDFHPRLPSLSIRGLANRIPPHCPPHGVEIWPALDGWREGMGLYCRAIYTAFTALRPIRWILLLGGGAWPFHAWNRFLLRPLIRRGPVPSCKASWFRSIEHANAPQFVPDVPVGASMTPSSPFPRFYIFLLRLYHMFEQRVDLKLKLERERERRWRNFLSLKKRSNLSTVPVTSVPEREIRNFIWIISFHGYSTGMEAAGTILKINFWPRDYFIQYAA